MRQAFFIGGRRKPGQPALPLKLVSTSFAYPAAPADRSRWALSYRGEKNPVDPRRPYGFMLEQERGPGGEMLPTATIFLTNRECPWRCLMCDLWKNTTDEKVPVGAIPEQIRFALAQLPAARQVKLYNSGSFFDPNAIPTEDLPEIAKLARGFERVIVECHPALVGPKCAEFKSMLEGKLEIAMGLETAHPEILDKLNKRMTLEDFTTAAEDLCAWEIDLRVFVLVKPPFMEAKEAVEWAKRSILFAVGMQAKVISLIPTRAGNGGLEELMRQGHFSEPTLAMVEAAHDYGVGYGLARVFADLWDLRRFAKCEKCFDRRQERLHKMNCEQLVLPHVECSCGT